MPTHTHIMNSSLKMENNRLTLLMVASHSKGHGKFPKLVIMKNQGLVVEPNLFQHISLSPDGLNDLLRPPISPPWS